MYIALVIAPVMLLLVGGVPAGNGFWVDAALAMGYAALAMMGIQFFLTARFRRACAPFGIDIIYYFHRLMALLGYGMVATHAVVLLAMKPGLMGRIFSSDMPLHAMAALASFALFTVIICASIWRKQFGIPYEGWRRWHGALSVAAVLLAVVHVELAGYYLHVPWKRTLWIGITFSWLMLLVYVRIVKPLVLMRRAYVVQQVVRERGDSWSMKVAPVGHEGFRFRPGQFAWVTVGGSPFSLSEHPFSISSSAEQGDSLTFTIKELGDFTRGVGRVAEGSKVYVDGPYGAFTVDNFPDARGFVFLAGGVGIAPVMGMLRTLADRGDQRPHVLLYGSWTWEHVIFREQLEELESRMNLRVVHVLQEAPSGWTGETGFLTESLLERQIGSETDGRVFFVCGPKPMIALVERGLHAIGVPVRAIQTELFDLV